MADQTGLLRGLLRSILGAMCALALLVPTGVLSAADLAPRPHGAVSVDAEPSIGVYGAVRQSGQFRLTAPYVSVRAVLEAAGGLTPDAYAFGAILLRRDRSGGSAAMSPTVQQCVEPGERQALAMIEALFGGDDQHGWVRRLSSRQMFRLPVRLGDGSADAEQTMLTTGDVLIIPPRQVYVYVAENRSLKVAPVLYRPGALADDYLDTPGIRRGGWFGRDVLVLPDGQTQSLGLKFWNYERTAVPPGSLLITGFQSAECGRP